MTTTMPTLPNHHQQQQRYDVARRISITCSNDNAAPSTPTRSHDSSSLFNSTNMPMLNRDNKMPIRDWFIMHSRTDSESTTCYYSPPTHLPLHPGYVMIGSSDYATTTANNTNICHEMNTGCSMFTDPIKKTSPTSANSSYDMSDDTNMKSSEEDFILVSPSFPDLSLSSSTSLDDIDISGHGDDMDDDRIDMDMLSISSSSPPPPSTTIRLAARPRSFSPSYSAAFTPSVVPRVSPIKQLSTLLSSTELNTFTPIQVQDDNHDDTTTKTSFRKSPYLW